MGSIRDQPPCGGLGQILGSSLTHRVTYRPVVNSASFVIAQIYPRGVRRLAYQRSATGVGAAEAAIAVALLAQGRRTADSWRARGPSADSKHFVGSS